MSPAAADAHIAQRDASRKLYFLAAGCLYHPQAHLVARSDPEALPTLEQMVESALKFAELSDKEAIEFRERAVAVTRVVTTGPNSYSFEQPDRPPRRHGKTSGPVVGTRSMIGLIALAAVATLGPLIGVLLID